MTSAIRVFPALLQPLMGGHVRRALPLAQQRTVGPFLFLDHMGPLDQPGHDVGPHPHIGLATATYLVGGSLLHRDSLGSLQRIEPGALNWMTAGRGIVHSEREPSAGLHGVQLWVALPEDSEDCAPAFDHYPADLLPLLQLGSSQVRVVVGKAFGATSPARVALPTLLVDVALDGELELPPLAEEQALYVLQGELRVADQLVQTGQLAVLPDATVALRGTCRAVLLGGERLRQPRHLLWNFASSRRERLREAAADWQAQRFAPIPDDHAEFVPLPERYWVERQSR